MKTPIINATAAVLIHAGIMIGTMMLLDVKYSLYCYVFSTVLYSLILCVLNQCSVHHYLKYRQGVTKTFLIPILASVIMGAASFGVYQGLYYLCKINIVALAAAVFVGAAVYFTLIIRCGVVSEAELRGMPKGHMLAGIAKKMKILKPEESSKRKSGRKKASKPPEKGKEYSKGKPSVKGEALQRRISGEEMPERRIWASEAERPDETDEDYWLDD